MKKIILNSFLIFTGIIFAQDPEEIIDNTKIIDSNLYNNEMIYVFQDNSWEYKKDYNVIITYRTIEKNGCIYFDSSELVSKNFVTTRTHSNLYNLKGLVDSAKIDLQGYYKPVQAPLSSGFKFRWGKWHKGHDLACPVGTPIVASWDGIVRYCAYNQGGYGNLIIIRHHNGLETYYAHLSTKLVSVGQKVSAGQLIGHSGNTGHSNGPHLHYEVRFLDNAIDPKKINQETLIICADLFQYLPDTGQKVILKDILGFNFKSDQETIEIKQIEIKRKRRKTSSTF